MTTTAPKSAAPPSADQVHLLVAAFRARTLPLDRWDHRAHCLVALAYLLEAPVAIALGRLRRDIRAFNEAHGGVNSDSSGYHETLTRVYVAGIAAFLAEQGRAVLDAELLRAFWCHPLTTMDYATDRYSPERLWSTAARRGFLPPDRLPNGGTDPRAPCSAGADDRTGAAPRSHR